MRKSSVLCLGITIILLLSACGMYDSSSIVTPTAVIHTESIYTPVPFESVATPATEKAESNCRLVVNGKDITSGNYVMLTQAGADLPLIAILKALGAKVAWQNNTTAAITFEGKEYILSTADKFLREAGGDERENFLLPPPGAMSRLQVIGNELILDDNTMSSSFFLMETSVKINVSYKDKVVTIISQPADSDHFNSIG